MYTTPLKPSTLRMAQRLAARPFSTTRPIRGIEDQKTTTHATDTTQQAKNDDGPNPAQQQANVVKQQSGTSAGQTQPGDSELTEKKKQNPEMRVKHGEGKVNPAVKGQ